MSTDNLRMIVAGGGTGGHVLPALALISELQRRDAVDSLLWIGSESGLERGAAQSAGIPYRSIQTGKLRRYFSLQTATDAIRLPIGIVQARRIVQQFQPTVVFSTGGFVSVPTVVAARGRAPILTHEQTAILGLATRINARLVDALAVSYDSTAELARRLHRRVLVTGNPVRTALAEGDPARGRRHWGFAPNRPLIYVTGGARGASPLNQRLAALLPKLLEETQILHQAGPSTANRDAATLAARRASWSPDLQARYQVVEFVGEELADVYAAADLIIGRAGAGTVAELSYLGKPSILIPLPGAGGDEQTRNAQLLAEAQAAIVIPQLDATPERLRTEIAALLASPDRLAAMADAARSIGRGDAAARLADAILDLHQQGKSATSR